MKLSQCNILISFGDRWGPRKWMWSGCPHFNIMFVAASCSILHMYPFPCTHTTLQSGIHNQNCESWRQLHSVSDMGHRRTGKGTCKLKLTITVIYRIAGNFGEVFNLAILRKFAKFITRQYYFIHYRTMWKRSRSPNLKFANAF